MVMDQAVEPAYARSPAYIQVPDFDKSSYHVTEVVNTMCDTLLTDFDKSSYHFTEVVNTTSDILLPDFDKSSYHFTEVVNTTCDTLGLLHPQLSVLDQQWEAGCPEVAIRAAPGLSLPTTPDSENGGIAAEPAYFGFANDVPMMVQWQQLDGNEQQVQQQQHGRSKVSAGESLKKKTDKAGVGGKPESRSKEALMEATLRPFLQAVVGKSYGQTNWWRNNHKTTPLLCPLTAFPICLLPYPPFKLYMKGSPCSLRHSVDGKFLALRGIATGRFVACGQELDAFQISKLDAHVSHCKLGKCRPSHAIALALEASHGATAADRDTANEELSRFVAQARDELRKLMAIQHKRLLQINQILPPDMQAILKDLQKSQRETDRFGLPWNETLTKS